MAWVNFLRRDRRVAGALVVLFLVWGVAPAFAGLPAGDADDDNDLDLYDLAAFQNCFTGTHASLKPECEAFQFDPDDPIGLNDYAWLQHAFGGPNKAIKPSLVTPPNGVSTGSSSVLVVGLTAGAYQVHITGGKTPVLDIPAVGDHFISHVDLIPNNVNQLYITFEYGNGNTAGPIALMVIQDMQPPNLFIDFPADGAVIYADNSNATSVVTAVAGRVNDTLSGFQGLNVKVNGLPAEVDIGVGTNGTFFFPELALALGEQEIIVEATDVLGSLTVKKITVTAAVPPPDAAVMQIVSGDAQIAHIHAPLAEPIVVRVVSQRGVPIAGKLVNFRVTRSDGRLAEDGPPIGPDEGVKLLQMFTDGNGEARAYWRLGSDAGNGNNRVEVTSTDIVATTMFCASAMAGAPLKVNVGTGNNQQGGVGEPAAEPLVVWVNDSCNPVPGVFVTFTVVHGGGKVNGQDEVTVFTSATGHAGVDFIYGLEPGNNSVVASFAGNPTAPARFVLVGVKGSKLQATRLTGIVLDNAEQPLRNATCTLTSPDQRSAVVVTTTDIDGRFAFEGLALSGPVSLRVDGSTVNHVGGEPGMEVPPGSYPSVPFKLVLVSKATNTLPGPALLPRLNPDNVRLYSTTQDTELTVDDIAGLKMTVKAGSMKILNEEGHLVPAPDGTPMSLNQVHHDDVPMPMTDGAAPPFAWTLQPAGAHFDPPVRVEYPNMSGLPAGAIANFLSFNHDIGKFQIVASGHVSDDGTTIVTDPGSGLTLAGWGCNCPPYSVTGQCCHGSGTEGGACCVDPCPPCTECINGACAPVICLDCSTCLLGNCVSTCGPCQTCKDGTCAPCGQCQTCVEGACITLGEDCGGGCCPAESVCCQVVGSFTCLAAESVCCGGGFFCTPPDSVCCLGGCAPDGATCCSGGKHACTPPDTCCGKTCCTPDLPVCCQGACYPADTECCAEGASSCPVDDGIKCCGNSSTPQGCCNGECVPAGSGCCADGSGFCEGGVCCGTGDDAFCAPASSTCCPGGNSCPSGSSCCTDAEGGLKCCIHGCCGVQCMTATQQCCLGIVGHPCNSDQTCCGATCCNSGSVCCDGQCKPAGTVCCPKDGSCPAALPVCCNGVCRPPGTTCCGNGSCPPGTTCCGSGDDAACYPAGQPCCGANCPGLPCCGSACQLPGQICCPGPPEHVCSGGQCCGTGCCSDGKVCCIGPGGTSCCNPGQTCNAGVCQ